MDPSGKGEGKKKVNFNLSPACGVWLGGDGSGKEDKETLNNPAAISANRIWPNSSPACGNWMGRSGASGQQKLELLNNMAVEKKPGDVWLEDMPKGTKTENQMLQFQHDIPKLPLPPLEEICEKFLAYVQPLLTPQQFKETKFCTKEFLKSGGAGEILWERLNLRSQAQGVNNWLEQSWNAMYDSLRVPLTPYISPGYVLSMDDRPGVGNDMSVRAATMARPFVNLDGKIEDLSFPPDVVRGTPLCMWEYQLLFSRTRIPNEGFDSNVVYKEKRPFDLQHSYTEWVERKANHIVAFRDGHPYSINCRDPKDGTTLPLSVMIMQFRWILEDAKTAPKVPAVSALTAENRDEWAKARKILLECSEDNKAVFEEIESAITYVALDRDSPEPPPHGSTDRTMLMGDPTNRWFDKGLGLYVFENGVGGFQFEHSASDAWPYICCGQKMTKECYTCDVAGALASLPDTLPDYAVPKRLRFQVPEAIPPMIEASLTKFNAIKGMLQAECLHTNFGKKKITGMKCSPDGFVQMAIQLAYYRLHRKPGSTYAAGGTKMFSHGRTETVRTVSQQSQAFCKAVVDRDNGDRNFSLSQLNNKFKEAATTYLLRSVDAKTGRGCDRALFGLKCMASEMGLDTPAIFRDNGYNEYLNIQLSTSNVPLVEWGESQMFGPVNETSYGVCYAVYNDKITLGITSFQPSMWEFVELLKKSFVDLEEIVKAGPTTSYAMYEKALPSIIGAKRFWKKNGNTIMLGTAAAGAGLAYWARQNRQQ